MVPISPVVEVLALDGAGAPISNMTISVKSATSLVRGFYPFLPADLVAAYNGEAVSRSPRGASCSCDTERRP